MTEAEQIARIISTVRAANRGYILKEDAITIVRTLLEHEVTK